MVQSLATKSARYTSFKSSALCFRPRSYFLSRTGNTKSFSSTTSTSTCSRSHERPAISDQTTLRIWSASTWRRRKTWPDAKFRYKTWSRSTPSGATTSTATWLSIQVVHQAAGPGSTTSSTGAKQVKQFTSSSSTAFTEVTSNAASSRFWSNGHACSTEWIWWTSIA